MMARQPSVPNLMGISSGNGPLYPGLFPEDGCLVRLFPGEVPILPAEVAIDRCGPVDGPSQPQGPDDALGAELKVPLDKPQDHLIGDLPRAEGLYGNGDGADIPQ